MFHTRKPTRSQLTPMLSHIHDIFVLIRMVWVPSFLLIHKMSQSIGQAEKLTLGVVPLAHFDLVLNVVFLHAHTVVCT